MHSTSSPRFVKFALVFSALAVTDALFAQRVIEPSADDTSAQTQSRPPVKVETAPPAETKRGPDGEEIVEMSVFTVTGEDDDGYQALNTTSGSRLKTRLKDTPASISPFTEEFLSDLGATTVEDILEYTGNVEMEFTDSLAGFDGAGSLGAGVQTRFRVRGIAAGLSFNGFDSDIPQNINDTERAEMSSGPNSILFGMGSQGGTFNFTAKRANLRRNSVRIKNVMKMWNNRDNLDEVWGNQLFNLDYNLVLMPRKMAFRLLGTYANSGQWKYRQFADEKRLTPTVTFKPFKRTTVVLRYETGLTAASPNRGWNAADNVTEWLDAGRPLYDNFGASVADDPLVSEKTGTSNRLIYVDNDGFFFNARRSLQSARSRYKTNTLLPASESSFDYSTVGPGAYRTRKFESWTATVEQRAGMFDFDFSYHHNKSRARAFAPNADAYDATLRGDPNVWLSPPQFTWGDTHSTDSLVLNPHVDQLFMDTNWQKEENTATNDILRLMGSAGINLKKFGRHNIVGMLEYSESERTRIAQREIYVDDNNVAIFNQDNPFNENNRVIRRHYVTVGDFTTYYDGDGSAAVPSFTIGDKTYHTTFVSRNQGDAHTTKENMSYMLALQSYWFRDHLVTTFGYRIDDIQFDREQQSTVDGENPLYLSGKKVLNEYYFDGTYMVRKYNLSTYNAGAVWHVTDRFSLFGNYSSNTGVPYTDNRGILPDGNLPPPAEGTTVDYGVMVDVLANNKVFLKLTRFDTRQIHDGLITPGGTNTEDNGQLGSTNLESIFSALYKAGLISQAEYDSHPHYNCGMLDVYTKGYEAELTANLKSWNFRVTYSYSERERRNIFNEVFAYYNANVPVWMGLARDHPDVINTIKQQLYYINEGTAVRAGLDDLLTTQTGSFGSVPHKVGARVRRTFKKGLLKGFTVGAGFRYNSRRLTPDPRRTGFRRDMNAIPDDIPENLGMDLDSYYDANMIKCPSTWFADMLLTYRRKVFKGKSTMMIQVNIKNLFDRYKVVPGRWAINGNENVPGTNNYNPNNPVTGYLPLVVRRVYINPPRTFQLTTQFDF